MHNGKKFSPVSIQSLEFSSHPPSSQPPDAVIKRLLINVLLETGFITLLHLSAGVG